MISGLTEDELKRRKNKKYELKKALKNCTYGDVNDKKYVKELIFDLLHREYGVNQVNITSAIDFDNIEKLTSIDKFDILLYMYKQQYGYNALGELIKKYNLDVIKTADYIIDLGPEGGDKGGTLVACGTPEEVAKVKTSYTGQYVKQALAQAKKNRWYE
jgi:hypothetical protein